MNESVRMKELAHMKESVLESQAASSDALNVCGLRNLLGCWSFIMVLCFTDSKHFTEGQGRVNTFVRKFFSLLILLAY